MLLDVPRSVLYAAYWIIYHALFSLFLSANIHTYNAFAFSIRSDLQPNDVKTFEGVYLKSVVSHDSWRF